jgi:hypothetical protein
MGAESLVLATMSTKRRLGQDSAESQPYDRAEEESATISGDEQQEIRHADAKRQCRDNESPRWRAVGQGALVTRWHTPHSWAL